MDGGRRETPGLGDTESGRRQAGASPAELLAARGFGAPLTPAGHRQSRGATLALHLHRLRARVAAACQSKTATLYRVRSLICD